MPLGMNLLKTLVSIFSPGQFSYRLSPGFFEALNLKSFPHVLPIMNNKNAAAVGKLHVQDHA